MHLLFVKLIIFFREQFTEKVLKDGLVTEMVSRQNKTELGVNVVNIRGAAICNKLCPFIQRNTFLC